MDTIKKAERTVSVAVTAAVATGAIPIPFADAPLLIGEQIAMMATIAKIFNIEIKKDGLKALASAALGVGGATLVGRTVISNLLKIIPGPGWLIGGAISGGAAGAITYGVGMAFIEVCKAIQFGSMDRKDITSKESIEAFLGYFTSFAKKWKKSASKRSNELGDSVDLSSEDADSDDSEGGGSNDHCRL